MDARGSGKLHTNKKATHTAPYRTMVRTQTVLHETYTISVILNFVFYI